MHSKNYVSESDPRIVIFGVRGFPGVSGGVETHVEKICAKISRKLQERITIIFRSSYTSIEMRAKNKNNEFKIVSLFSPNFVYFEAIVHTFLCAWFCIIHRSTVAHVHSVTNGWIIVLLKAFFIKIIFTHHGRDYERDKWPWVGKKFLKISESIALRFSDQVIFVSKSDYQELSQLCKRAIHIPNGYTDYSISDQGKYSYEVITVSRIVPEKGIHRAIEVCQKNKIRVGIIGDGDQKYLRHCKKISDDNFVYFHGELHGEEKIKRFIGGEVFVSFSNLEGFPIAVLEALSLGKKVLLSHIPAHLELELPDYCYFDPLDEDDFLEKLKIVKKMDAPSFDRDLYRWENIAKETETIYRSYL